MPVYSFQISKRMPYTQKVSPKSVIIFESIFALHEKRMRDLMDLKLFFYLDSDIRLMRRISRDINDRSRAINTVLSRYIIFVKPAFDLYIKPTRKYADFVIPSDKISSFPLEMISQILNDKVLGKKKNSNIFNADKSSKLSQEEHINKKYFENPEISCLCVVKDEKELRKFNKIIHYLIKRAKASYYSLYATAMVQYLLEIEKRNNTKGLQDENQLMNLQTMKEELKYEK